MITSFEKMKPVFPTTNFLQNSNIHLQIKLLTYKL